MKHFLLSISLILTVIIATAQPTWKNISDTRFVRKIVPDGNKLWLSSEGGLMCIDHSTNDTTFYNHANSGMPFTDISDMCLDIQGRLWLTSYFAGIACKDGNTWTAYNTTNSTLPNNRAVAITSDSQGNIWACINNNLVKFDGNTWLAIDLSFMASSNSGSEVMAVDAHDRVLMNANGLWAFDGNTFVKYDTSNSPILTNRINFIKTFPDGKTWIGHFQSGLTITDFTQWEVFDTLVTGKALYYVNAFDRTPDGKYWLGCYNGDLYYFDGTSWGLKHSEPPADTIRNISFLAVDNGNNLFIGSYQSSMFDGNYWYKMNTAETAFKGNMVEDIFHASDNSTWIANPYGMTRIIGNTITNYYQDDSSANPNYYLSATCFAEDNNGKLYAGHYGGVSVFENNEWHRKSIPINNNLFSSSIPHHIAFDMNNSLFIAQFWGIVIYNGVSCAYYSPYLNNFPASEVLCLTRGTNGHIYAGYNNGFSEWNGTSWITHMIPNPPVYDCNVWDISIYDNIIWMATSGGLIKYDGSMWEYFNPDNCALNSFYSFALNCDKNGMVWMQNGVTDIATFDGQNWQIIDYFNSGMLYGSIRKLRIDKLGNKWMGSIHCGISIYNENGIFLDLDNNKPHSDQVIKLVYPNPATDEIKISYLLPDNSTHWKLIVTDQLGKTVDIVSLQEKDKTYVYHSAKLTSGEYLISISNGIVNTSSAKILIVR
ncbi:MAG: T9SS type A sorting domain-containing protein [Bacteroidota bacterium]